MKYESEREKLVTTTDLVRMAVILAVWALLLAAPLLPVYGLELSAQTAQGEFPGTEKIPLTFQSVEASIHNQVAATQSWFHFRNDFEADLEVTCAFVLGHGEFVEGFSYYNGDERIVGEVLEKEAAQEVYQELTQMQRDPGILEQTGSRFRFRVYPVQPGEVKPVEVRHLSTLATREGVIEYVVPRENLPAQDTVFSFILDITDELPVAAVEVEGVAAQVKRFSARHVRVVFESQDSVFDQDIKVRYRLEAADYAVRFVAHRAMTEDGAFMLLVTPKNEVAMEEVIGRDIVFVIDVSGSMDGEPLDQTRLALVDILARLHPRDRFEIVAFDDEARGLLGDLQPASAQRVRQGQNLTSQLQSQGGTNILKAMRKALDVLAEDPRADRPRAIIFLTDGQGSNPASVIISEVRRRDRGVRVYTFGVGNGVNRPFLERLARDNRGIATLVTNPDHLEREMRRLYDRISMPLMVDLDLQFEGLDVHSVYPGRLPDLYRDGEVAVLGRYRRGGQGKVVLTGRLRGEETRLEVDVALPDAEERFAYVEKLWARQRIDELMDHVRDGGDTQELVQEVTRLGIVYNLVTEYTTFLAVPEALRTDDIKELIRKGQKGYDRRLIDSIEGIKLSMQHIPPGDPVLTVEAPAEALKVEAFFPFGLVKRLKYDAVRGAWNARFLVPRDVADGLYAIRVLIVHADGTLEWRVVDYYIDGTAPEFDAEVPVQAAPGETIRVEVDPYETVWEVFAWMPGLDDTRIPLELDPATGRYVADITLPDHFPEGPVTLRIVVRDLARNRFQRDFEIWSPDAIPGC